MRTTVIGIVGLVLAACGGGGIDVATGLGGPSDIGPPSGAPAIHDDGLLAGVPGTCRLVEPVGDHRVRPEDADLAAVLVERVDVATARGPLVGVEDDAGRLTVAATLVDEDGRKGDVAVWEVDPADPPTTLVARNGAAAASSDAPFDPMPNPITAQAAEATDCSYLAADRTHPEPPPPAPEMRPDLLVLDLPSVPPGSIVELRFPEETMRGIAFQLDVETSDGWETRYWLTSDGNGGEPTWVPVGTEGYGWPDVGVDGPGPDRVPIPDEAPPGRYRICTANAAEDFCAPIEVVGEA